MLEARPKYRYILIGGESKTITMDDFDFYSNNVLVPILSGSYQVTIVQSTGKIYVTPEPSQLTVSAYKHVNSTSFSDDYNNGHPNTWAEDTSAPSQWVVSGVFHIEADDYYFILQGMYFAAMHKPAISVSRLKNVIGVTANTYSGIFTTNNINKYSPIKSDKVTPHKASEWVGYCHRITGNAFAVPLLHNYVSVPYNNTKNVRFGVYKMPASDPTSNNEFRIEFSSTTTFTLDAPYAEQYVTLTNTLFKAGTTETYVPYLYMWNTSSSQWVLIQTLDSITVTYEGAAITITSFTYTYTSIGGDVSDFAMTIVAAYNLTGVKIEVKCTWGVEQEGGEFGMAYETQTLAYPIALSSGTNNLSYPSAQFIAPIGATGEPSVQLKVILNDGTTYIK